MVRVGVCGASGRSGAQVIAAIKEFPAVQLGAALVSPYAKVLGTQVPGWPTVSFSAALDEAVNAVDVFIDFSTPQSSLALADVCAKVGRPMVIATTGFSAEQRKTLRQVAEKSALVVCANTSLGVVALTAAAKAAQRVLGSEFQIEIVELHHHLKKDAPSGTALHLAQSLRKSEALVCDRSSNPRLRGEAEIGIASVRAGDIVGEHTLYFVGPNERVELTHRAYSRAVFARGALHLALKLPGKGPGMYSAEQIYFEED